MISQLQQDVVQGPLEHPRFGKTVIVRPTLETARAGVFPTQAVVVTSAARILIAANREGDRIKAIVVEGKDHDPTMHPEFNEISKNLRELINKHFGKAKFHLLADAPQLDTAQARHGLVYYDFPTLRLEAGSQKVHTSLRGEKGAAFKARVENMTRLELEKLVLSATFVRGDVDNSTDAEIKSWLKHVTAIKPGTVQISTLAKATAKSKPITKTRINEIAELVTEKTGISVDILD